MTRYYRYQDVELGPLVTLPCAVCGQERERLVGMDGEFRVVKCVECGFVFVNPRPTAAQLRALYERYYLDDAASPEMWRQEMDAVFRECRALLVARRPTGRVLDVGCSFGHFLASMEAAGWEAAGVEPSPVAAREARRRVRGRVEEGDFEEVALAAEGFDAVVCLYVLEHVADPRAFVARMHGLLRAGGVALLRVPHTEPLMAMNRLLGRPLLQAPMHLNDFSPAAMTRLARAVGFDRVEAHVGAVRRSHDRLERAGAFCLGGLGRLLERASGGRVLFPWVGAYSYVLTKDGSGTDAR